MELDIEMKMDPMNFVTSSASIRRGSGLNLATIKLHLCKFINILISNVQSLWFKL